MQIEKVWEGKITHWRVSEAGSPVTVRCSDFGVYCCLTCCTTDCVHAKAVKTFDLNEVLA